MSTGPFPQPNYPGFPLPHVRPRRTGRARVIVAAVLAVLAAAALVAGSFLPSLKIQSFVRGTLGQTLTITSWGRTFNPPPTGSLALYYSVSHVALYGIPLAVIAAGLLTAAAIALAQQGRGGRAPLAAAGTAAAAAAFMLAMDIESSLSYAGADPTPGARTEYTVGLGAWIVGGGAALGLIAALLTIGRTNHADSDATPPQGFRAPAAGPPSGYAPAPQYYPPQPPPAPRTPPPSQGFPAWPQQEPRPHGFYNPPPDEDAPRRGVLDAGDDPTESRRPHERD